MCLRKVAFLVFLYILSIFCDNHASNLRFSSISSQSRHVPMQMISTVVNGTLLSRNNVYFLNGVTKAKVSESHWEHLTVTLRPHIKITDKASLIATKPQKVTLKNNPKVSTTTRPPVTLKVSPSTRTILKVTTSQPRFKITTVSPKIVTRSLKVNAITTPKIQNVITLSIKTTPRSQTTTSKALTRNQIATTVKSTSKPPIITTLITKTTPRSPTVTTLPTKATTRAQMVTTAKPPITTPRPQTGKTTPRVLTTTLVTKTTLRSQNIPGIPSMFTTKLNTPSKKSTKRPTKKTSTPQPKLTSPNKTVTSAPRSNRYSLNGTILLAAALEEDVTTIDGKLMKQLVLQNEFSRAVGSVSFAMDVWLVLSEILNFRTKFVFRTENPGGPGSFVVLRNLVRQGKAQLVMSPTTFTNQTVRGLDLSQPVDEARNRVYVRARNDELGWKGIGSEFSPRLWMAVAGILVSLATVLVFIETAGRRVRLPGYVDSSNPGWDKGQIVMAVIGHFCYEGSLQIASACAGRVVVFSSLLCGYMVYVSYGVFVISRQTASTFAPPFQSLEELADRGTHRLIVAFDPTLLENIQAIRSEKQHALSSLWRQLLPDALTSAHVYEDLNLAMRAVCSERVALMAAESKITGNVMSQVQCQVMPMTSRFFTSGLGLVFERNSTFTEIFERTLMRMREVGILDRWRSYWNRIVGVNQPPSEDYSPSFTSIGIREVAPALLIYAGGLVLSLGILVLEMAISIALIKWRERRAARAQNKTRPPAFPFTP